MPYFIIFIILFSIIISYCIFVIFLRQKLNKIENNLRKNFKIKNNKIFSLFFITKNFLNKHNDVFKEFFELKKKDFSEDSLNFYFENKLNTYKNIHKEIDFIFKICELNQDLKNIGKYNYIKSEILKESSEIGKKYNFYEESLKKYKKHHKISKFFLVGFFLR